MKNVLENLELKRRDILETRKVLIELLKEIEETVTNFQLESKLLFSVRELQSNCNINTMKINEYENFMIKLERVVHYIGNLEVFMDNNNECKERLININNNYKILYYNLAEVALILKEK